MRAKLRRALRGLLDRAVEVEVIGQEECPLMLRWTFLDLGFVRAMIHFFPAEVSDRDPHDHPRSFVTFVLRGDYRDESWPREGKPGTKRLERVRTGAVKYRPAEHMHIVETDARGCWTLVVMGPLVREWGFMRLASGAWWPWGKYVQNFGGVVRCDAPADTMNVLPKIGDWVEYPGVGGWNGKVESISGDTVFVRRSEDWKLSVAKVSDLVEPVDLPGLEERYYRRAESVAIELSRTPLQGLKGTRRLR